LFGSDALGERGKRAEAVGTESTKGLLHTEESGSVADNNLGDNLIPLMALVGGTISVPKISDHTRTNIWVCERFLPVKFKIADKKISC